MQNLGYDIEKFYDDLMEESASYYWHSGWTGTCWLGYMRASFLTN